MSSIERLKQELIYQKSAIESKGGVVNVANTNPSPAEISAGIDGIKSVDISQATAQEGDVLKGKTFYAVNNTLRTGTLSLDTILEQTFLFGDMPVSSERYTIEIPEHMVNIREYFMYSNPNYLDIYFHSNIERIEGYTFGDCSNFNFYNFSSMNKLEYIGVQAFMNCNPEAFDLSQMPANVKQIQQKAFQNVPRSGMGLIVPNGVTSMGTYAFSCDSRVDVSSFSFPSSAYVNTTLPAYSFQNIGAHYDLYVPDTTQTIGAGFNKGGSFDNVSLGIKVKSVLEKAFGSNDTDPVENFFLRTVTFNNPTPPSITTDKVFAMQNLEHDFKIYVPDSSLEEYKAVSKLRLWYDGYIYPISMKE